MNFEIYLYFRLNKSETLNKNSESDSKGLGASDVNVEELGTRFTALYQEEYLGSLRSLTCDQELCLDERDAMECLLGILQVNILKYCIHYSVIFLVYYSIYINWKYKTNPKETNNKQT